MKQPSSGGLPRGVNFDFSISTVGQRIPEICLAEKGVKKQGKGRDFRSEILGKPLVEEGVNHG